MTVIPQKIPVYPIADYGRVRSGDIAGVYAGRLAESFRALPNRYVLHRHEYFEVFLVEGKGTFFADFTEHAFSGVTLIVVSAGQVHGWKPDGEIDGVMAAFTREFLEGESGGVLAGLPVVFNPECAPLRVESDVVRDRLRTAAERMHAEFSGREAGWEGAVRACLQLMLTDAGRLHDRAVTRTPSGRADRLVSEFRMLIESRYAAKTSLGELAAVLGVTPGHLNDTVKARTGSPAGDLLRDRRLLEAKRLLLHSQLGVAEIAYKLGYDDPSYFARSFRRETGASPANFREQSREKCRV